MNSDDLKKLIDYQYHVPTSVLKSINRVNNRFLEVLSMQITSLIPHVTSQSVTQQLYIISIIPFDTVKKSVAILENAVISSVVPNSAQPSGVLPLHLFGQRQSFELRFI